MSVLEKCDGDWKALRNTKTVYENLNYEEVISLSRKVFAKGNTSRKLAVGYTPMKVELGVLPAEYTTKLDPDATQVAQLPFNQKKPPTCATAGPA